MPLIELKSVSFSYDGADFVLKDISLQVSEGERVAVLGHNGSGKSTLVKILGALQVPSRGACFVRGLSTADSASLAEIHRRVSLVFQNPESQIVAAMVEDDVAFAPENYGVAPEEIEKKVDWALKKIGLFHKKGSLSSALSGGEKQRLALAGALASGAECLILDEPTAMLDPEGRAGVENILRGIHASGTTIIQVSHILEDVVSADRILVLSRGSWAWQGSSREFWPRAESLGFKLPPMLELKRRVSALGFSPCETLEDAAEAIIKIKNESGEAHKRDSEGAAPLQQAFLITGPRPMFNIKNLSHSFAARERHTPEHRTLEEISCVFPKGQWTSVLGRTGSGKSTLIQHLNGLYGVQEGEIFIADENSGSLISIPSKGTALRALRRRVGLVFQAPEDQLFSNTVREELEFAPVNWGFSKEDTDASAERALRGVGLGCEYLARNPLRLSGGERRLVAIASVLSADPDCLVLDEPTAGLDAKYRGDIISLLSRLRDAGKTIITVTHDFEMAFEQSGHLIVMDGGRKVCGGSVAEVLPALLETDATAKMLPEIVRLSALLRSRGVCVPLTWRAEGILGNFEYVPSLFR